VSRRSRANGNGEKLGLSPGTGTLLSYMQERRLGFRVPFETMVTSYVHDRPVKGLASNLSDSGMSVSAISMLAPPPGLVVGVELEVPGVDDSIWAAARVCYRKDDRMASGLGMRFVAMAKTHARIIREFCIEMRRKNLGSLLARIRA
jgi:c-di-GMP-binding flagellar brake protein YcgR